MSPIHPIVWIAAVLFQVMNGISFGGYLGGYGPNTRAAWLIHGDNYKVGGRMELGMMIWALGFIGNVFHDDELREIRRATARNQKRRAEEAEKSTGKGKGTINVDKVYLVPQNGLFWYILYPHYFCEWIEWGGFWIMGGLACTPARNFLLNEIATMLPRAVSGRKWYIEKFGKEKIGSRKAVIPGIL
jgi:3-oxo-5-alpha-steroid 4-dehydrogenase 1